jgi:hypothetical protein
MLSELKRVNLDGAELEQLMALSSFARNLKAEYAHRNVPTPSWLDDKDRELTREITRRNSDELQRRLNEIKAQQAALMTPAEKREKLAREQAELEKVLGITTAAAPSA